MPSSPDIETQHVREAWGKHTPEPADERGLLREKEDDLNDVAMARPPTTMFLHPAIPPPMQPASLDRSKVPINVSGLVDYIEETRSARIDSRKKVVAPEREHDPSSFAPLPLPPAQHALLAANVNNIETPTVDGATSAYPQPPPPPPSSIGRRARHAPPSAGAPTGSALPGATTALPFFSPSVALDQARKFARQLTKMGDAQKDVHEHTAHDKKATVEDESADTFVHVQGGGVDLETHFDNTVRASGSRFTELLDGEGSTHIGMPVPTVDGMVTDKDGAERMTTVPMPVPTVDGKIVGAPTALDAETQSTPPDLSSLTLNESLKEEQEQYHKAVTPALTFASMGFHSQLMQPPFVTTPHQALDYAVTSSFEPVPHMTASQIPERPQWTMSTAMPNTSQDVKRERRSSSSSGERTARAAHIAQPPSSMPAVNLPGSERTTPLAGQRLPPSTQYPSSFHSQTWTHGWSSEMSIASEFADGNETLSTTYAQSRSMREKYLQKLDAISAIREGLGWLPAEYLHKMSKDELKDLIVKAIEVTGDEPSTANESVQAQDGGDVGVVEVEGQSFTSPTDWFERMGGGKLPSGWSAEYDSGQDAWYFINDQVTPTLTTWEDPRIQAALPPIGAPYMETSSLFAGLPAGIPAPVAAQTNVHWANAPLPLNHIANQNSTREYADWYARVFAGYQAHRQFVDGEKGPVEAQMKSERQRVRSFRRAQSLIEEATRRLREALTGTPNAHKERERKAAEIDLARAQGMMDRLQTEDSVRASMLPPWMEGYRGVAHGFEQLPREKFNPSPSLPLPPMQQPGMLGSSVPFSSTPLSPPNFHPSQPSYPTASSAAFSSQNPWAAPPLPALGAHIAFPSPYAHAAQHTPPPRALAVNERIPASMTMPSVDRLPRGVKFKGSSIPTPYGMPEVCFAWDMLLRSATPTAKLASLQPQPIQVGRSFGAMPVTSQSQGAFMPMPGPTLSAHYPAPLPVPPAMTTGQML